VGLGVGLARGMWTARAGRPFPERYGSPAGRSSPGRAAEPPPPPGEEERGGSTPRQRIGLVLGPAAFVLMLLAPPPEALSVEAWRTAATGVLMAVWWVCEPLPIPATAPVPIVAFPVLGILPVSRATAPYANPLIYLFLPAAVAASCAFLMPVATPPNAIVYGSGYITIPQMARAGFGLNLVFVVLVTLLTYTVAMWVFGIRAEVLPAWALPQ
jgi:di/tricarboxylate transporter